MQPKPIRIGIDISQIQYTGTGVARYVTELTKALVKADDKNHYVLFASSLRNRQVFIDTYNELRHISPRVTLKMFPFPIFLLETVWNRVGIFPIEWLIGSVDIFWSSDWVQPPLQSAIGVTTIHDVSMYRFPESFTQEIGDVHKRRLLKTKQWCSIFFCDSQATKDDVRELLGIDEKKLRVIYPGFRRFI